MYANYDGPALLRRDGNRIQFLTDRLKWPTHIAVRKKLYYLTEIQPQEEIVIDFSSLRKVYPNGIVPTISHIDALRTKGFTFRLVPPADPEVEALCRRHGWFHYIDPDNYPAGGDGIRSLSLHRFTTDEELNSIINRAIEICLQQLVFAEGVPAAFEWVINELAGNVLVHAEAAGFVQVVTYRENGKLVIIVADAGVGIPTTIRKSFTNVGADVPALELAIRGGITSKPDFGQGNGLAGSIAIAQASGGYMALTSGRGRVTVAEGNLNVKRHVPPFEGTCVEVQLPTGSSIDLPRTLWGHSPVSHIELKFTDETGENTFRLRDYASSFGNRITGERIRKLVMNLLIQQPGHRIRIVMDDVSVISSSFADELFGKLALELGIVDFGRLISLVGLNALCKSLIDTAIRQRLAQAEEQTRLNKGNTSRGR